jgi:glyoxylase I family protein
MEKVSGIGGVFFRAANPSELSAWYETHLGVSPIPTSYDQMPWMQEAGPTVFAPFEASTDYFGKSSQVWMINFRVNDLDKMVSQLQGQGIEVTLNEEEHPNGRFARLQDPEGNPIELWEPAAP